MPKHIGIVAISPEGSALCYRDIFRYASRRLGDRGHPVVTLHNAPLAEYVSAALRNDWHAVGEILVSSAKVLAAAGAEFCIVPDNLIQFGIHLTEGRTPIPFLTMTDLVAEAIEADGRKSVGLIGTKLVMLGSTYQTVLGMRGVRVEIPSPAEADDLDAIIFRELLFGIVQTESRERIIRLLKGMADRGCEGVILGCSEAPLVVTAENSPLPVYDATALLAEGAVRCALGERPVRR